MSMSNTNLSMSNANQWYMTSPITSPPAFPEQQQFSPLEQQQLEITPYQGHMAAPRTPPAPSEQQQLKLAPYAYEHLSGQFHMSTSRMPPASPEQYMRPSQTPTFKKLIENPRELSLGVKNPTFDPSKTDPEKLSDLSTEFGTKADEFSQEESVENLDTFNPQELSKTMFIKIKSENISKFKKLTLGIKRKVYSINKKFKIYLGQNSKQCRYVSIKEALQINTISKATVFDLSKVEEADVDRLPLHSRQIELIIALKNAKIKKREKIWDNVASVIESVKRNWEGSKSKKGEVQKNRNTMIQCIKYKSAKELDLFFGTKIFDFKQTLSYAIQIAKEEIAEEETKEFPAPSSSETAKQAQKKRKRSDISTEKKEGSVVSSLKRQRTQQETNLTLLNDSGEPVLQPPSNIEFSTLNESNFDSNAQGADEAPLQYSFHAQTQSSLSNPFPPSFAPTPTLQEPSFLTGFMADSESNVEETTQPENASATLSFSQQTDDVIDSYLEDATDDYSSKYENWDV